MLESQIKPARVRAGPKPASQSLGRVSNEDLRRASQEVRYRTERSDNESILMVFEQLNELELVPRRVRSEVNEGSRFGWRAWEQSDLDHPPLAPAGIAQRKLHTPDRGHLSP
jgi:hypothetical protein